MIYIQTDSHNKVILIYNSPFDEKYGLGKSEEELLATGFLVDFVPRAEEKDGYYSITYYTKEDGFYFQYEQLLQKQHDANEAMVNQIQDDLVLSLIDNNIL